MTNHRKRYIHTVVAFVVAVAMVSGASQTVRADDPEFDALARHLKLRYNARRVSIPFLGLASFFVKIVRPAGVESFKVAIFEDLSFSPGTGDSDLRAAMRNVLSPEWQPLVRVRSAGGEQVYVYVREAGENFKLMVLTIDRTDAVVARVKVSPKKLSEFLNNPRILGISLGK